MPPENIGLIGAGSWGTALACLLAKKGHNVQLWAYEHALVDEILKKRENTIYLPGVKIPPGVTPTASLQDALKSATRMVLATPSHAARSVLEKAAPHLPENLPLVCATKGIENSTQMLMSQVIREALPAMDPAQMAILSGPSFAKDVCAQQPTAVTLACENPERARQMAQLFITPHFKVFTHSDLIGVQLGGSLKNIVAVMAGIAEGLGLGANTHAAVISRGLSEMARLGTALGADPGTFSGLSGLGDLVLTSSGRQSRNKKLGISIGQGQKLADLLGKTKTVAEGVETARATRTLAHRFKISMPVTEQTCAVLFEDKAPQQAIDELFPGAGEPE